MLGVDGERRLVLLVLRERGLRTADADENVRGKRSPGAGRAQAKDAPSNRTLMLPRS